MTSPIYSAAQGGLHRTRTAQPVVDVKSLHAKIGELTLENDFFFWKERSAKQVC